jgi:hypothetical protein
MSILRLLPHLGDVTHPDAVTGALSEMLLLFAHPATDTLEDSTAYRGLAAASLFPAPRGIPDVRVERRWRVPGLVSEDLVFRSKHRPLERKFRKRYLADYRETHTVYARRIRPAGAGHRPRLLYLHGFMQPESPIEEVALLASMALRLDMEVIQLQPPYHGRRTPRMSRFGGEFYWTADVVRSIEALRQNVLDARTLLSWLLDEDPRPVGVSGISLGGSLAAVLTCVERRFAFSVPLIAHMDIGAIVEQAPVLSHMRRELRQLGWSLEDFADFVKAIGWHDLAPRLPPERIRLYAASEDLFFHPATVEDMWRRWGRPPIRWYPCSHMGFIVRLPEVMGEVRAFVDSLDPAD